LDVAADLSLSTFSLCATAFPQAAVSIEMKREADTSPYTAAANTLQALLCLSPQHFLSNHAIAALGGKYLIHLLHSSVRRSMGGYDTIRYTRL
jgi:hypothetical protein